MLVVRVELHHAMTREISEIARMHICNDATGTHLVGNYEGRTLRGATKEELDRHKVQRRGIVLGYPRRDRHVFNLVTRMLVAMGYTK